MISIIKYIKKLVKKQKLIKKYTHKREDILSLIEIVGIDEYQNYYLSHMYYEKRCCKRLKKL